MLSSCTSNEKNEVLVESQEIDSTTEILNTDLINDIDTSTQVNAKEFKENLKVIEKKYGEQWGFCKCVVANDSVNEAIMNTTDFESKEFEKLMLRSDLITQKCQAFLSMDANKTPEERAKHEKRVKDCLKNN